MLKLWTEEKRTRIIQPIPRDFYLDLARYIKKIQEEKRMLDEKTVKGALIWKEEENVRDLFRQLIQLRFEKVVSMIRDGETVPLSTLTKEEEIIYRNHYTNYETIQNLENRVLQGKLEIKETNRKIITKSENLNPPDLVVLRILRKIPEIIGSDKKTYGPFDPEDIATVPKENARALIREGSATKVER